MVFTGPVSHYMYQFLEGAVSKRSQFSSLKKVVIDRALFAPPYLLALFYFVAIMEVSIIKRLELIGCNMWVYHFKTGMESLVYLSVKFYGTVWRHGSKSAGGWDGYRSFI